MDSVDQDTRKNTRVELGFFLGRQAIIALLGYKAVNAGIVVACFAAQSFSISLVQVYGPI